jgi:class 3 adenylate cyclase
MNSKQKPPTIHNFLPKETVEMLTRYGPNFPPDLAFEEEMTLLFSDMRGFTELAESYDPHEVYATLNASLGIQTQIVHTHGGSINKFLGDGLLAGFSGHGRSERAVNCVLEMLRVLPGCEGETLPCRVGFSLHCGKVLLGLLGNDERREFAIIGDVANTAARLCGIAKPFQALISEDVANEIPSWMHQQYCTYLRPQIFKGKTKEIEIYEVKVSTTTNDS